MLKDDQIEKLATITKRRMKLRLDKSYIDTKNQKYHHLVIQEVIVSLNLKPLNYLL